MAATRATVRLRPGFERWVESLPGVTEARKQVAAQIASSAASRSRVTRARGTWRAEVERSHTPPKVAAVGGYQHERSFIVVFEELSGSGFRPPPAPLRTAAERFGRVSRTR